ncbi:MAG: glucoamylase family protein, partial [Eubacteriales bacterium]
MDRCGAGALCVVTCLVGKPEKVPALCRHLEVIAISSTDNPNVCFGLLADFPETSEKTSKNDAEIEHALREGIDALNASSEGHCFCFLTRERVLYPREGRFLPWERKRGALLQLVSLMSGEKPPLRVYGLTPKALRLPFLITLDEDTRPDVGSLDVLLTAAAHPLNTPVVWDGVVRAGYGILQPRLETSLTSDVHTRFAGILAGGAGFDLYGDAAGEWNTDLYGTTPFTGKGLICVQAFREVMRRPFPENAVLSHDLPEGELLRTACCAGAASDDRFPTTSSAYYARLHRWIRGDVQNLRFLFRRGFLMRGRGRVLANLLRAWLPAALTAELLCACFFSPWLFLPVILFLSLGAFFSFPSLFHRTHRLVRLSSPLYPGAGAEWLRAAIRLMLLPVDAWTCVDASIRALFRMLFTHRGLLDWTTFADASQKDSALYVSSLLAGLAATLSFRLPGLLLGAYWVLAPLFVWMLERENVSRETLSDSDRLRLREMAGRMLGYYLDNCTEENHWLPPDNVQEQPAAQTAHRTSPTNIGLAMLSLYAGVELGLVDRDEGLERLSHMTDTLERIPKWNGHLPNWIDTRTLEPLRPRWVSTVDSGNLAVCLWSLCVSLPLGKTRGKLGKILRETDFAALYDEEQELLYLGYELERERFSPSHYDLMASEARLASYVGIAMGQLPARHWKRLRRTVVTKNGEGGMASWSGTMFEYFLPALFLPRIRGSFMDETLNFALKMQKKAAHRGVFGMSESGFFAFDASLAYQYKAHGADALSVRADRQEPVYAPYAAYLALPWSPCAALRTLSRYDAFGMRGQYGLYEALDFDRRRTREENGMPVRSYMAHHIGMSILAVYQTLTDGGAARVLAGDARFRAFEPLLAERIPYGAEGMPTEKPEEKTGDRNMESYRESLPSPDAFCPRVLTLGNAGNRVMLTDTGLARSQAGEITVCGGLEENAGGLSWTLECGGDKMPLAYAPA